MRKTNPFFSIFILAKVIDDILSYPLDFRYSFYLQKINKFKKLTLSSLAPEDVWFDALLSGFNRDVYRNRNLEVAIFNKYHSKFKSSLNRLSYGSAYQRCDILLKLYISLAKNSKIDSQIMIKKIGNLIETQDMYKKMCSKDK